jgi:ABC-2 type transport system ATP-binding protein
MDEARNCDRIVMINEGRIVASGTPSGIVREILPQQQDATLNDAFIRLMTRSRK